MSSTHPIHFLNVATTAAVGAGIMYTIGPATLVEHSVAAAFFALAVIGLGCSLLSTGGNT